MATIGLIVGSGAGKLLEGGRLFTVSTPWGEVQLAERQGCGHGLIVLSRHGSGHRRLSHQVNHRANLQALHQVGVHAVVGVSAVGVLDPRSGPGQWHLFDDLYFPSNRLADGSLATWFLEEGEAGAGHWIPDPPFCPYLRALLQQAADAAGLSMLVGGSYGHVDGPRLNTRVELRQLAGLGITAISQTCGPEAVLAGEAGLPYALLGYGVNHLLADAPGTKAQLDRYLGTLARELEALIAGLLACIPQEAAFVFRSGVHYRL